MADADEMIAVADLAPALRTYLRRDELEAGQISRRVLRERQRGAEGRIVADARSHGVPLFAADRDGDKVSTTAAAEVDTSVRVR